MRYKALNICQGCVLVYVVISHAHINERRFFSSSLSQTSDLLKKDTQKSKWIKVKRVKNNHITLEKILGRPPGLIREPSLGSRPTVPIVHSCFFYLRNHSFSKEPSFSTGSFHSSTERALALTGRAGRRGMEGQRGEMKRNPEKGEMEEGQPFMSAGNLFVRFL